MEKKNHDQKDTFISSRIIITGLSELSKIGQCIGQFLVNDLDTLMVNKKIESVLYEDTEHLLIDPNYRLNPSVQLSRTGKFHFKNIKNDKKRESRYLNGSNEELWTKNVQNLPTSNEIFELFLNRELNIEEKRTHEFILMFRDFGETTFFETYAHLMIVLKDENDNKPKFKKNFYQFSIYEWFGTKAAHTKDGLDYPSLQHKLCVGQITATDSDILYENSFIQYELTEIENFPKNTAKATDLFFVNQTSGIICVKKNSLDKFDRELKSVYNFRFTAINKLSANLLKSSVLVEIILKDLNDNRPEFSLNEYTFFIPEKDSNIVNTLVLFGSKYKKNKGLKYNVGRVIAVDKDLGINSELKYFLQPKNEVLGYKSYFELNTNNPHNPYSMGGKDILTLGEVELNKIDYSSDTPRLFKVINDINDIIYINSTTGQIFLLKEFDREKITHIRFRVFVSDRLGEVSLGNEAVLSNSVPVIIEFIDMNDSSPKCENAILKSDHENTIYHGPQYIFAVYVNFSIESTSTLVTSYPIYKLDCKDMDLGKNAELNYEIEKVYLKNINGENLETSLSLNAYMESLTLEQRRILGHLDQTKDFERYKKTYFLTKTQLFAIDSKTGIIYFNHIRNLWLNNIFYQTSFFNNLFLILRVKVRDNGMINSYSSYMIKLRFCFRNYEQSESSELKYCDFKFSDEEAMKNLEKNENNKIIMQKLFNVNEELKVFDYGGHMGGLRTNFEQKNNLYEGYEDSSEYILDSAEFDYGIDTEITPSSDNIFATFGLSKDKKRNKTKISNKSLIPSDVFKRLNKGVSCYHLNLFVFKTFVSIFLIIFWNFS